MLDDDDAAKEEEDEDADHLDTGLAGGCGFDKAILWFMIIRWIVDFGFSTRLTLFILLFVEQVRHSSRLPSAAAWVSVNILG